MSAVSYDVANSEPQSRLTTFFRMILVIPHAILSGIWGWLAQVLGVLQWFIILFTGKRNESMWKMQSDYLGYSARVLSYAALLHGVFPPFGTDPGATGVSYAFEYEESANRLSNALRMIWSIPAFIISEVLLFAVFFVTVIAWFSILFTAKYPPGMHAFAVKAYRYYVRTNSYTMLMTDTYPKYE